MDPASFQPDAPGTLVETEFRQGPAMGATRISRGHAFIPHSLPPNLDPVNLRGRLFDELERARLLLERLDAKVGSLPSPTILLAAMRTREAQASSRIENTVASLREIELAQADGARDHADALEVLLNRMAIERGLASPLPICTRLVREMHAVLIRDPALRPGEWRDRPVYIGDHARGFERARFVPPPADRIPELMGEWEKAVNATRESRRFPYLAELAFAHYQFETIHPFNDGNGRLGRAMVNLAPVKDSELRFPVCNLSEWIQGHRDEYYDRLLEVSTKGAWEAWVRFFCVAIAEQAQADLARADRIERLYSAYCEQMTGRRKSSVVRRLVDHIFERRVISTQQAADAMGVSYTAAQRHIADLVKLEILAPLDDAKYAKLYIAQGVLDAIRGDGEE